VTGGAGLLCIRHAESTLNAAGCWQGQADPPLSERGRAQAAALAAALAPHGLDALVSSDLARARETAAILGERLGLVPVLYTGLRELDVGEWSALPHAEIARRWPLDYARFRAGALDLRPGGGETRRELAARVTAALGEIGARWPLARVGLVTHMGVLRALVPSARLGNAETIWLGGPGPAQSAWIGSEAL
jgi:probable phosphoglycerate mutase